MSLDDDFCVAIAHDGTIEGTTEHLDLKTRCYDDGAAVRAPGRAQA